MYKNNAATAQHPVQVTFFFMTHRDRISLSVMIVAAKVEHAMADQTQDLIPQCNPVFGGLSAGRFDRNVDFAEDTHIRIAGEGQDIGRLRVTSETGVQGLQIRVVTEDDVDGEALPLATQDEIRQPDCVLFGQTASLVGE